MATWGGYKAILVTILVTIFPVTVADKGEHVKTADTKKPPKTRAYRTTQDSLITHSNAFHVCHVAAQFLTNPLNRVATQCIVNNNQCFIVYLIAHDT